MKKVLVIACVIVMAAAAKAYASPAVDSYIQAIANLPSPLSNLPPAPKGYGSVRYGRTGDFLILVPREYCGIGRPCSIVVLGLTRYGSQIRGYCEEF
jgi:hypothetical protein